MPTGGDTIIATRWGSGLARQLIASHSHVRIVINCAGRLHVTFVLDEQPDDDSLVYQTLPHTHFSLIYQ